jgi:hypothetical protein
VFKNVKYAQLTENGAMIPLPAHMRAEVQAAVNKLALPPHLPPGNYVVQEEQIDGQQPGGEGQVANNNNEGQAAENDAANAVELGNANAQPAANPVVQAPPAVGPLAAAPEVLAPPMEYQMLVAASSSKPGMFKRIGNFLWRHRLKILIAISITGAAVYVVSVGAVSGRRAAGRQREEQLHCRDRITVEADPISLCCVLYCD